MDPGVLNYQQSDFALSPSQRDLGVDRMQSTISVHQQRLRMQNNMHTTIVDGFGSAEQSSFKQEYADQDAMHKTMLRTKIKLQKDVEGKRVPFKITDSEKMKSLKPFVTKNGALRNAKLDGIQNSKQYFNAGVGCDEFSLGAGPFGADSALIVTPVNIDTLCRESKENFATGLQQDSVTPMLVSVGESQLDQAGLGVRIQDEDNYQHENNLNINTSSRLISLNRWKASKLTGQGTSKRLHQSPSQMSSYRQLGEGISGTQVLRQQTQFEELQQKLGLKDKKDNQNIEKANPLAKRHSTLNYADSQNILRNGSLGGLGQRKGSMAHQQNSQGELIERPQGSQSSQAELDKRSLGEKGQLETKVLKYDASVQRVEIGTNVNADPQERSNVKLIGGALKVIDSEEKLTAQHSGSGVNSKKMLPSGQFGGEGSIQIVNTNFGYNNPSSDSFMLPKHGNNNGIFGRNRNDLLKNQQLQFTSSAAKLDFPTLSPQQEYEDEYQPADYGNIYEHNNIENDKFKMQKQMAYLIENKQRINLMNVGTLNKNLSVQPSSVTHSSMARATPTSSPPQQTEKAFLKKQYVFTKPQPFLSSRKTTYDSYADSIQKVPKLSLQIVSKPTSQDSVTNLQDSNATPSVPPKNHIKLGSSTPISLQRTEEDEKLIANEKFPVAISNLPTPNIKTTKKEQRTIEPLLPEMENKDDAKALDRILQQLQGALNESTYRSAKDKPSKFTNINSQIEAIIPYGTYGIIEKTLQHKRQKVDKLNKYEINIKRNLLQFSSNVSKPKMIKHKKGISWDSSKSLLPRVDRITQMPIDFSSIKTKRQSPMINVHIQRTNPQLGAAIGNQSTVRQSQFIQNAKFTEQCPQNSQVEQQMERQISAESMKSIKQEKVKVLKPNTNKPTKDAVVTSSSSHQFNATAYADAFPNRAIYTHVQKFQSQNKVQNQNPTQRSISRTKMANNFSEISKEKDKESINRESEISKSTITPVLGQHNSALYLQGRQVEKQDPVELCSTPITQFINHSHLSPQPNNSAEPRSPADSYQLVQQTLYNADNIADFTLTAGSNQITVGATNVVLTEASEKEDKRIYRQQQGPFAETMKAFKKRVKVAIDRPQQHVGNNTSFETIMSRSPNATGENFTLRANFENKTSKEFLLMRSSKKSKEANQNLDLTGVLEQQTEEIAGDLSTNTMHAIPTVSPSQKSKKSQKMKESMTKSQMEGPTPLREIKSTSSSLEVMPLINQQLRDSRQSFDRYDLHEASQTNGNGTQTHNYGTNDINTENRENSCTSDQPATISKKPAVVIKVEDQSMQIKANAFNTTFTNPCKNGKKALKQINQDNDMLIVQGCASFEENSVEINRLTPKRMNDQGRKCFSVLKPSSLQQLQSNLNFKNDRKKENSVQRPARGNLVQKKTYQQRLLNSIYINNNNLQQPTSSRNQQNVYQTEGAIQQPAQFSRPQQVKAQIQIPIIHDHQALDLPHMANSTPQPRKIPSDFVERQFPNHKQEHFFEQIDKTLAFKNIRATMAKAEKAERNQRMAQKEHILQMIQQVETHHRSLSTHTKSTSRVDPHAIHSTLCPADQLEASLNFQFQKQRLIEILNNSQNKHGSTQL